MQYPLTINQNGRRATLTKARVPHRCCHCQEYIATKAHYYAITINGSGLGNTKFPDRVHTGCLRNYFLWLRERQKEVERILSANNSED